MLQGEEVLSQNSSNNPCIICNKNHFIYAFKIGKDKFLQCIYCYTIVREKCLDLASQLLEDTERDIITLTKLILDTIKDRAAKAPFCVVATPKECDLVNNLLNYLPKNTVYYTPDNFYKFAKEKFNTIITVVPLSTINNSKHFLLCVHINLHPDGVLLFLQPMIDSSQAKIMRNSWLEWHQAHTFYPTRAALHMLLLDAGFAKMWFRKARYRYTLGYIYKCFKASNKHFLATVLSWSLIFPAFLRRIKFKLPSSHIIASCQKSIPNPNLTLSIVIPVYNEKDTFEELIQTVLEKTIIGLQKEIIIVESNSTDGTHDLVKKYEHHTDVHVIWQSQARGKGVAVQEGLAFATGDYILIQDADLEYDINDYESLLEPLRNNQAMWVLGSRHNGTWKIREFSDAALLATIFNMGHVFFTWFINFLTGLHMTDPFTMFKVFRRDAIFGIEFTCKRFDFDHEMVIKFARKGYQPLEVPVNYRARSFTEGKKVSFIKDGLTWVFTDLKLRFGRLGKWQN